MIAIPQDRWEQTPNIVSGLEETGSELLTYGDSGELLMEDSSRDEASGEPEDLWQSSAAIASRI
jgi:hypothetical protein